jgi:hypothetical protein
VAKRRPCGHPARRRRTGPLTPIQADGRFKTWRATVDGQRLSELSALAPTVDTARAVYDGDGWEILWDALIARGHVRRWDLEGDEATTWATERHAQGILDDEELEEIRQRGSVGLYAPSSPLGEWALRETGRIE